MIARAIAGTAKLAQPDIEEVAPRVPSPSTPGRSIVSRRAVVDIVRAATLGSYGVTGFASGLPGRILERLGIAQPGIRVTFADRAAAGGPERADDGDARRPSLGIDLDLDVAFGVPIAEVARQVDSAVRYAVRRALDIEVDRLTIHVDGLTYQPGDLPQPARPQDPSALGSDDLAASGTDVA
jgi:uncharacterized alkaline shock family protein YloU